jgi:predicted nucleotidyltransferase
MNFNKLISDKRDQILEAAAKYGASNVRVFGSAARGDSGESSDVDFLVDFSSDLKGIQYFSAIQRLEEELERILDCRVDVVDERGLRERIRDQVLAEARAI